jgi:protein SCO1/2
MDPMKHPLAHRIQRTLAAFLAVTALVLPRAGSAETLRDADQLDRSEPLPKRLQQVDVTEHLGAALPLDTAFTDSAGKAVKLRDYFDGVHPVIVTFNYANCPMLCSLQLSRFVEGLKQLRRSVGDDFKVVTLSIDPAETTERAAESRARYLRDYGRPGADAAWQFLHGVEGATRRVADAAGFGYAYNEERHEWLHAAALIIANPDGRVGRYLYGIQYHPETLNLSIVEASEGKIGSTLDRLMLFCFHFDETEGRYAPVAFNIMRLGAGASALALGAFLSFYWFSEFRKRKLRTLAFGSAT